MICDRIGGDRVEDREFMEEALRLAAEAAAEGEVPVGCVITLDGRIVGRGRNRRERAKNALAHAELEAIDEACRTLGIEPKFGSTFGGSDGNTMMQHGIPCAVLSCGMYDVHSVREYAKVGDIVNGARLIAELITQK